MRTIKEFNEKFVDYLEDGHSGLLIEVPQVVQYLEEYFKNLIKIPDFKYTQIDTIRGIPRVINNLEDVIGIAGKVINSELEDKISFILKVEFEIENRLLTLNLDKNGKPLQSL